MFDRSRRARVPAIEFAQALLDSRELSFKQKYRTSMLLDNLDGNFSVLTSSGIICRPEGGSLFDWIPAFAGMTERERE